MTSETEYNDGSGCPFAISLAHFPPARALARHAAVHTWLRLAAKHAAPVLITGETGTGKEVAAQLLVRASARGGGPLVTVNCGALAPSLVASELFGHDRGAFTGAIATKQGAFAAAHGGSLFLDEVGDLPLDLQPQLLRALETGEVRRVGGVQCRRVDVRIIAATNRNLARWVDTGTFRADLFHRLHVLALEMPPLRDRIEDLPLLVEYFCVQEKTFAPDISKEAWTKLLDHPWPGNVRELKNVLSRALTFMEKDCIEGHDIQFSASLQLNPGLPRTLAEMERDAIVTELSRQRGNRSATANALGFSRSTMYRRLQTFGLL